MINKIECSLVLDLKNKQIILINNKNLSNKLDNNCPDKSSQFDY